MMRTLKVVLIGSVVVVLTACPSQPTVPDEGVATDASTDAGTSTGSQQGIQTPGLAEPRLLTPEEMEEQERIRMLQSTVVYFDYDQSDIRPEFLSMISAHAARLAGGRSVAVRLEGHADERGSREYNIGLGERRAQAVRRALMLQGVSASQVRTVSYGEERPAAFGHDDSSWAQNRRVEIVYPK